MYTPRWRDETTRGESPKERGQKWETIEAPLQLPEAIIDNAQAGHVILIDCLTLLVNNLLMENEEISYVQEKIPSLVHAIEAANCPLILVSNEVGTGIVPENKLARMFRDLAGYVKQAVAESVYRVIWMVAGIPVTI